MPHPYLHRTRRLIRGAEDTSTQIGNRHTGNGFAMDVSSSIKRMAFLSDGDGLLGSSNYLDQLAPVIKTHLQNNSVKDLVEALQAEGAQKDEDLARTVGANEDRIAQSAEDIGEISRNAAHMNEQILDISDHMAKTSNLTFEKKFQLIALKKNINKIHESEILINKILQVLELTDKTHELIKNDKFFQALKSLNGLNSLNKDFDRDFIFMSNINASIPILKNLIRDESLGLLKRNLGSTEPKFEALGTAYSNTFESMIQQFNQYKSQHKEFTSYKVNSPVEVSLRELYLKQELPDVNEFVHIGFIYDTLLIFKTLEQTDFLRVEINKEMNIRRDKIFYPFVASDNKNEQFGQFIKNNGNLQAFLNRLAGYLVFYKSVSDKLPHLFNMNPNDLWENLSAKIYPHLKNLVMNEILEKSRTVEVKRIVGNFYLILEHLQLNTERIYDILLRTFEKFSQISFHLFGKEFQSSADEDDAMPMLIYDLKLYKKISHVCWYSDTKAEEELEFPLTLPFSTLYPMACAQLRNFIAQETDFLQDYYKYDLQMLNESTVDFVDKVLSNTIDRYYQSRLKDSLSREELAQNVINLEYFLIMSKEVWQSLSSTYGVPIRLKSIDAFSNTRKKTEDKLFEVIDNNIYDLLEMIDWDWQSKTINKEPTYFIRDTGDFLQTIFNSALSKLPYSVKTLLLYRVFDLLAGQFTEHLISQPTITKAAVLNFDTDISYIEEISRGLNPSKSDRQGTSRDSLQSMFLQLRQRINLLKAGHLDDYSDQATRMRQFDQIKPEEAVNLVKKLRN